MKRIQAVYEIGDIIESNCTGCLKRIELSRAHNNNYSYIDGHCNKVCPVGKQLQELGKKLVRDIT